MTIPSPKRVVLITGASSGIGAALALECARAGMDLALGARRVDRLRDIAAKAEALGARCVTVACDVDKDADVQALFDAAIQKFGKIDIAVANAGYGIFKPVVDTTDEEVRQIFETNVYGSIRVIRLAVPLFRKQGGGQIVLTSSAGSNIAPGLMGPYSATKASQKSIAQALRAELKADNIFVTTVHPIGTRTEFSQVARLRANVKETKANTPVPFRQTSEHVARCMVKNMLRSKPRPEVWPSPGTRFILAMLMALPRMAQFSLNFQYKRMQSQDLGEEMQ